MDNESEKMNFWQDHSSHYLEMAFKTDNREILTKPDGYGKKTGDCGDTVEFYLSIKNDLIEYVSFQVQGCMNTTACANTVVLLAKGKSVEDAWNITPEDVIDYLETLPEDHVHCAELAIGAFYLALSNYQELSKKVCEKIYH
jgi:nitrogen fixation NifU-like protein